MDALNAPTLVIPIIIFYLHVVKKLKTYFSSIHGITCPMWFAKFHLCLPRLMIVIP